MADKVTPGARVATNPLFNHSGTINDVLAMRDRWKREELWQPNEARFRTPSTDVVFVRNVSGTNMDRGDTVQLNGTYLLDEIDPSHLWFEADTPTDPMNKIAILIEPLRSDDIGRAQMSGVCIANINIGNVAHTHASPSDGSTVLTSSYGGILEILSTAPATGEQILAVRFADQFSCIVGKATGTVPARSSNTPGGPATVNIWRFNETSGELEVTSPTQTVAVYNMSRYTVTGSVFIQCKRDVFGTWWVDFEDCS